MEEKEALSANEITEKDVLELGHSLKFANEIINELYHDIGKTVLNFSQNIDALLKESRNQFAQVFESFSKTVEEIRKDGEAIAPFLQKSNLWINPSAPIEIFAELRELVNNGNPTSENIEKVFIGFYEEDNWQLLRDLVDYWGKHPNFAKRMEIIRDALDAHIAGKYTLSIPTLLPQIEGLLSSLTGEPAGKPTKTFKAEIEKRYDDIIPSLSKDILLSLATSPILYGSTGKDSHYFTPEKFPEWLAHEGLTINQVFNRHAILHGVQIEYASKINSLKTFMLLDVICHLE